MHVQVKFCNMCVTTISLWGKCSRQLLSLPAAVIGFAPYHTSKFFFSSVNNPTLKRLGRVSNKSNLQAKPAATQRKDVWSNNIPSLKKVNNSMSSELKKLSMDDHTKRSGTVKQRTSLDSKGDNYEFVFGVSPCILAITQGRRKILALFVKEVEMSLRASVLNVCEEAHRHGVPIHRVSKKDIDRMAPGRVHQGVCLQASPLTYVTEEKSWSPPRKDKNIPLWLVLERVQDPMNLGAILRSAYFLGVDRVVSSIYQSCPLSPVVSKASSGVMEVMEVYGYKNLGEMLKKKVAQGWEVVGAIGSESGESCIHVTKCSDFTITKPTLLLIGSEGLGLSQELLSHCQTLVTISAGRQLCPGIESLNVSVATGILLHSLLSLRWSNQNYE